MSSAKAVVKGVDRVFSREARLGVSHKKPAAIGPVDGGVEPAGDHPVGGVVGVEGKHRGFGKRRFARELMLQTLIQAMENGDDSGVVGYRDGDLWVEWGFKVHRKQPDATPAGVNEGKEDAR